MSRTTPNHEASATPGGHRSKHGRSRTPPPPATRSGPAPSAARGGSRRQGARWQDVPGYVWQARSTAPASNSGHEAPPQTDRPRAVDRRDAALLPRHAGAVPVRSLSVSTWQACAHFDWAAHTVESPAWAPHRSCACHASSCLWRYLLWPAAPWPRSPLWPGAVPELPGVPEPDPLGEPPSSVVPPWRPRLDCAFPDGSERVCLV